MPPIVWKSLSAGELFSGCLYFAPRGTASRQQAQPRVSGGIGGVGKGGVPIPPP
jgi:hypothetical protein